MSSKSWYTVPQDLDRLNVDLLDSDEPFEIDQDNAPHLAKHLLMVDGKSVRVSIDDVSELFTWGAVRFYEGDPARGPAHWLIVCRIEDVVVTVPIVPAANGDPSKCRPIGLFETTGKDRDAYLKDEGDE